jgi:hypothetical protein
VDICGVLLSWVLHLSDYEQIEGCPEIVWASHAWLEEQACDGGPCEVLGWFPGSGNTIYLDENMDLENNLVHASIALHEIVHWVQGVEGTLTQTCESSVAAEREAYRIQRLFLEQYGTYHPVGSVLAKLRCD